MAAAHRPYAAVEVPASHVSYVSHPDAATQLSLQAVEATMPAASRA
jgi:hypothetical protein